MPEQEISAMDPAFVIADLNARVRALENKYNTLTERLLVVNQNMIEYSKKVMKDVKELSQESKKMKMDLMNTQEAVKDTVKEMSIFAKKDQLKVLERYMNMINILKLVTDEQLDVKLELFKKELKSR